MNAENYEAIITDETFEFHSYSFDDTNVTGAEIANAFGAHPVEEYRLYVQLPNLDLEELRPLEKVDISQKKHFFVIRGDADYSFIVDGINLVWPKSIPGRNIKKLIKSVDEIDLYLERKGEKDELINDGDVIDITRPGLERLYTQKRHEKYFEIIVEGTLHKWFKDEISYEEVVTLEVPDFASHPNITYSVKYKKGPGNRPEGILSKGFSVKIKNGMVFNVSETGQS